MKQKDVLMIGGFIGIAIVIYVFFFTDVVTGMFGLDQKTSSSVESTTNGFENFNTKVESKEVDEFDTKEEAYLAEELEEEQRVAKVEEEERKREIQGADNIKVNDLTELVSETSEKKVPERKEPAPVEQEKNVPVVEKNSKSSTVKKETTSTSLAKKQAPLPEVKKEKRKRRTANPSFGEEEASENAQDPNAIVVDGVIHGDQTIKSGERVLLRITEVMDIPGCAVLDANMMLPGTAKLEGQRLMVVITTSCDDGKNVKLGVVDPGDNLPGLYIELPSDDDQTAKEVAGDAVVQGAQNLGVPLVGRSLQRATSRKMNSEKIKLESNRKILLQIIK